jgi:very-short-patch-repair endonuclease/predicted transcriptional regulator of viral defense system
VSHVDNSIAALAGSQHGTVSRAQLFRLGVSARGIQERLRDGRLHLLYRSVYLVGHTAAPPLARQMGAVLACGVGALLSHRSAIEVWELLQPSSRQVHVTVTGNRRSRNGLVIHRSAPLEPRDYGTIDNIPVTNVGRSLLDFAEIATPRELERAFDEARTQRLVRDLDALLARHPGRRGAKRLAVLNTAPPLLTQSEAEELLLALIREASLPLPETNVRIGPWQLDFFWRAQSLNVEVDGHRYHSLEKAIARNHVRDADLEERGIRVRRVTARELVHSKEAVVARVARALSGA